MKAQLVWCCIGLCKAIFRWAMGCLRISLNAGHQWSARIPLRRVCLGPLCRDSCDHAADHVPSVAPTL